MRPLTLTFKPGLIKLLGFSALRCFNQLLHIHFTIYFKYLNGSIEGLVMADFSTKTLFIEFLHISILACRLVDDEWIKCLCVFLLCTSGWRATRQKTATCGGKWRTWRQPTGENLAHATQRRLTLSCAPVASHLFAHFCCARVQTSRCGQFTCSSGRITGEMLGLTQLCLSPLLL